jgi:hypothetical protein
MMMPGDREIIASRCTGAAMTRWNRASEDCEVSTSVGAPFLRCGKEVLSFAEDFHSFALRPINGKAWTTETSSI